jgi:hypothetical protein
LAKYFKYRTLQYVSEVFRIKYVNYTTNAAKLLTEGYSTAMFFGRDEKCLNIFGRRAYTFAFRSLSIDWKIILSSNINK